MGTNTGLGIGIGIPFKNNALGGDRPYLPPELKARLIGVWDNYGKKNTDADRNIIKNKIPNAGGDLEILNATYKLNSGFGEYKEDFTSWRIYPNIEVTDNVITTNGNFNSTWFIYKHSSESKINEMNIKVSGIPKGGKILYFYISDETANLPIAYTIPKDGIYHLPESKINNNRASVGFTAKSSYDWNNIRIEQIPSFEGAFVTDGIDDLITSTKTVQEMLGGSNEITVVSMIHQVKDSSNNVSFTNYIRGSANGYFRNIVNNYDKTGIYGYTSSDLMGLSVVNNILGDKNDYTSNGDNRDSIINGNFSVQGYSYNDGNNTGDFSSVAWYWTIIANKVLTTDQINQVIAYFNLDRTLKSDIYCNIAKQGITNENHAEFGDKLIDFSGNGRDIQLNNLAWKGGSGVAAKQYETFKDWTNTPYQTSTVTEIDEFTRVVDSTSNAYWVSMINRTSDFDKVHDSINIVLYQDDMLLIHECKYKIDENVTTKALYETLKSGVNTITLATIDKFTDIPEDAEIMSLGEWVNPKSNKGSVKITLLPSYKGGLLLDGVNDFGKVTGMPIYKDYTFIIDYERISYASSERWVAGVVSKSHVANQGAFILMTANTEVEPRKQAYSFGGVTSFNRDDFTRALLYQSKYKCGDVDLTVGEGVDSDTLWLGTFRSNDQRFFNGAIYSLMSFPYSMSEFLIERQLKKHKLGTLYPNMVEFRPVIKSSVELVNKPSFAIRGTSTLLNTGDYIPENSEIWMVITMNNVADRITKFVINGNTIDIPSSAYNPSTMKYGFPFTIDSKSPQKITMTIEQDENYVKFEPVITSNVEYVRLDFYLNNYQKRINIGDYIPKDAYLRANIYLNNNVDELAEFTFNGVNIGYRRSSVDDTAFNIGQIYNYDSPQEVNITIDEYIRYEDIVQPYPVLLRFNDENGNEVSWGGKFRVGSTITRIGSISDPESNLLNGLYSVSGLSLNGKAVTSSTSIVEKQMVFRTTATWLLDNNEPKVILSPRLLSIPNSSYKILGYIPDISGHGNNGVIHNSAYAEGSGVNEDGSYQFDGVDDFITIPTTVGGKQVLMKVNWNTINSIIYDQRRSGGFAIFNSDFDTNENKVPAYRARNIGGSTYIDGILNKYIYASELKNITHNIVELHDPKLNIGTLNPKIGSSYLNSNYTQMSLYDFMLFDEISTDDKIKELNKYVGIEAKVELPPYYWDTYGKTNLDADKATIQQRGVAVGDYDLTNYNHAYDKMSGYDGYEFAKFDNELDWYLTPDNGYIDVVSRNGYSITLKNLRTSDYSWYFQNSTVKGFITKDIPFKVKANKSIRVYWDMHSYKSNGENFGYVVNNITLNPNEDTSINLRHLTEEELTELDANKDRMYYLLWFDLSTLAVNEEVTIEMLPLYPNGLVYDAVTDYSKNSNIPALDDFTAIMKRKWLKKQGCPLIKGSKVYEGGNGNALLFEWDKAYNFVFYKRTDIIEGELPDNISFITPTNYNGNVITRGSEQDTNGICIAGDGNAEFANMVFYKLILYPKTIPLLQINFLKNLMEKDEIIDLNNPIFIKNE